MANKPDAAQLELRKQQLIGSLGAVAGAMRECASIADQFVQMLGGTPLSPNGAVIGQFALDPKLAAASTPATKGRKRKGEDAAESADAPKKKRVTKKLPRDPNAPRRPPSSYLYFQNEVRSALKSKYPQISQTELLTRISQQWSEMSKEERDVYETKQAVAKRKYTEEKAVYDARLKGEGEAAEAAAASAAASVEPSSPVVEEPATPESEPIVAQRAVTPDSSTSESGSSDSDDDSDDDDDEPATKPTPKSTKSSIPEPAKKEKKTKKAKA